MLSGQGGAAGMKYIANGKRHQQEIGARRWRPCLIKTNCRWAWIFFFFLILTEDRLKLPSETRLQPPESRRAGRRRKIKDFHDSTMVGITLKERDKCGVPA